MTMNARRRRAHDKLAALPGVRPVRRPFGTGEAVGTDREFDLYYVRTGRKSAHPVLVVPGGPGAASVALYRAFRRRAAVAGLDVIMVEHRGVGLSRHDDAGADLPPEALSVNAVVDDLAAVLDDAQVDTAIVYGASYGTYLAAGLGVAHPKRIHAMVLDSPLLCADDIDEVRAQTRRVLWDGAEPGTRGAGGAGAPLGRGRDPHLQGRPAGGRPVRYRRSRCAESAIEPAGSRARLAVGGRRLRAPGTCWRPRPGISTNPIWSSASPIAN